MANEKEHGQSIPKAIFLLLFGGFNIFCVGYLLLDSALLASRGVDAIATVQSSEAAKCGGRKSRHICYKSVLTNNEQVFHIQLDQQQPIGKQIAISYVPGDLHNFKVGHIGGSPLQFFLGQFSWGEGFMLAFGIFLCWQGIGCLRSK